MLPQYSWWGGNNPPPPNLRTPKQLSRMALAPRQAVGVIYRKGGRELYLYDPKSPQAVFRASQFEAMRSSAAEGTRFARPRGIPTVGCFPVRTGRLDYLRHGNHRTQRPRNLPSSHPRQSGRNCSRYPRPSHQTH